MLNFASIINGHVQNLIHADSLADAETATGTTCVEYTEDTPVWIGQKYDENGFEQVQPEDFSHIPKEIIK